MDKITKREMYTAIAEGVKSGSFAYDVDDIVAFCNKEIDALGERAAQALRLQAIGYSYAEIQDIIGGNANAIKTMVSRGRAQVKKNLGYHMVA